MYVVRCYYTYCVQKVDSQLGSSHPFYGMDYLYEYLRISQMTISMASVNIGMMRVTANSKLQKNICMYMYVDRLYNVCAYVMKYS